MGKIPYKMAIPIIAYAIVASYYEYAKFERNRAPKEDLRQASSNVSICSIRFSARNLPGMKPVAGLILIRKALGSKAYENVKKEARELEKQLNRYRAYVRFADRIEAFRVEFDLMRTAIIID